MVSSLWTSTLTEQFRARPIIVQTFSVLSRTVRKVILTL
nr:MAG TPA: hypothetical protein [Caudoviricetes sp.]